jgi:hypothetical protein
MAQKIALEGIARLVRGGAALNSEITKVLKSYGNMQTRLHEMAVSAMLHAAEDGQPAPLTALHDGLSKADQTSFKAWVCELAGIADAPHGLGLMNGWLDMKGGKFIVVKGRNDQRKVFAAEANVLTVLDGRKFMDKKAKVAGNDDEEANVFDAPKALKSFEGTIKKMRKDYEGTFSGDQIALVNKFLIEFAALIPQDVKAAA